MAFLITKKNDHATIADWLMKLASRMGGRFKPAVAIADQGSTEMKVIKEAFPEKSSVGVKMMSKKQNKVWAAHDRVFEHYALKRGSGYKGNLVNPVNVKALIKDEETVRTLKRSRELFETLPTMPFRSQPVPAQILNKMVKFKSEWATKSSC
ncbi:hypothetical protein BGZ65_001105 [Modicella reniformis]|uniref:Uncharacterized protein n=1 Tax=Modicella reniformis TaxID=1440133 RepID=A0A9P6MJ02_9FUNG|nr:hypothetical protein BGZ65_001105 [Modicella reniformis]